MTNPQHTPHYQHDYTQSSSSAPSQAGQRQTETHPDAYMANRGCSCPLCSTRHDVPPARHTMEHQNPWPLGDPVVSFANQVLGADSPTHTTAMVNPHPQAQLVAPQVYNQDSPGYIALRNEARFPRSQTGAGFDQTQILDVSVTENLRRLAWHFVNNPESLVNVVRLEPGISGGFRVVIILEVTNIL